MINEKGSAINIFLFVIVGFTIALTTIIAFYVASDNLVPQVQAQIGSDPVANATLNTYDESLAALDYFVMAIFMGLIIMAIVAAMLTRVHPGFLFFYALLVVLAIVTAVPLSNSYQTVEAAIGTASDFTITSFILGNLPLFTAVVGTLILIVTFVSISGGGRGS